MKTNNVCNHRNRNVSDYSLDRIASFWISCLSSTSWQFFLKYHLMGVRFFSSKMKSRRTQTPRPKNCFCVAASSVSTFLPWFQPSSADNLVKRLQQVTVHPVVHTCAALCRENSKSHVLSAQLLRMSRLASTVLWYKVSFFCNSFSLYLDVNVKRGLVKPCKLAVCMNRSMTVSTETSWAQLSNCLAANKKHSLGILFSQLGLHLTLPAHYLKSSKIYLPAQRWQRWQWPCSSIFCDRLGELRGDSITCHHSALILHNLECVKRFHEISNLH